MNRKLLCILFALFVYITSSIAQNKIGNNPATISPGSLLELESSTKGLRLPRIQLNDVNSWSLDGTAVSGMLICNEGGTAEKGIYYWNTASSKWVRVLNNSELASLIAAGTTNSNALSKDGGLVTTVNGKTATATIASGTAAQVLGFDATGNPVYQAPASLLTSATTNVLSTSGNTITSNVNGVEKTAPAVNSVDLAYDAIAKTLTTTVNGVADASPVDLSAALISSTTNVLSTSGKDLKSTVNGVESTTDLSSAINAGITKGDLTSSDITVSNGTGTVLGSGTTLTLPSVNSNIGEFNTLTVNAKGQVTAAKNTTYQTPLVAGTDFQTPLTFSTGLTNTSGVVTVNTSQNISTLSNLITNGLIKTSGGTGALSIATPGTDYVTPSALSSYQPTLTAGTGINIASDIVTNTGVTSITGAANQVIATSSTGGVTLSTPQDIATSSTPSFAGATLSGLTAKGIVTNTALGVLGTQNGTGLLKDDGTGTITYDNNTYLTSGNAVTSFSGGSTGLTPNTATTGAVTLGGCLGYCQWWYWRNDTTSCY